MRRLISLLILLSFYSLSHADSVKFNDVPENHWAEKSVQKLVEMGVTSGYPDNTFQGLKNMTREEMATFLSNLAKKIGTSEGVEKIGAELKNEYTTLKYESENPSRPKLSGEYSQYAFLGNPFTNNQRGIELDYRLKLSFFEKMGQTGSLKVGLDTVDSVLSPRSSDLINKFLNIDARLKLGNINYKLTFGPGYIIHRETDSLTYSDDAIIFSQPISGAVAQTYFQNLDLSLGLRAYNLSPAGEAATKEVFGKIAYTYKSLPIAGRTTIAVIPHYFANSDNRDLVGEIAVSSSPLSALITELTVGKGNASSRSALFTKASVQINTDSTAINLTAFKAGSEFRKDIDRYAIVYLNSFNKMVLDGSSDIGLSIKRQINPKLDLSLKTDAILSSDLKLGKDYAGTSLTTEIGLNYSFSSAIKTIVYYRNYFVPSKASSKDPAISIPVPELSDYLGISFSVNI